MNKVTLFQLTAALMLVGALAACDEKHDEPQPVAPVEVTFLAHLPATIDARAIGDGSRADELFFWVYDENDQEILDLRQRHLDFDATGTGTVTAMLQPGHTYKFAFWAQRRGTLAYDPDNSDLIQISYDMAVCNDEDRDAFYGWIPELTVTAEGELTQNIVLTRRLAQLNVGISVEGYTALRAAGLDLADYDSEVTIQAPVAAAYSALDLKTGKPVTNNWNYAWPEVTFAYAAMPGELLNAVNRQWFYLALNYFQPTVDDYTLVDVTMWLRHKTTGELLGPYEFPNVTVRGHERTNLLIESLTTSMEFQVVIDENFENHDHNIID